MSFFIYCPDRDLSWQIEDDASWIFDGLLHPAAGDDRDGDFRKDMLHELAHWLVAEKLCFGVEGLGIYGLEVHHNVGVRVKKGGGVPIQSGKSNLEFAAVHAAGIVAEHIQADRDFSNEDPRALFLDDPALSRDYAEIVQSAALDGVAADDRYFKTWLGRCVELARYHLRPSLETLTGHVLRFEQFVLRENVNKIEIVWSAEHAALLTGQPPHDFAI